MDMRGRTDSPPAHSAQRILIVEDEPALLRALVISFRARGYDVAAAASGGAALTQAGEQPPDAVLLDLGLPDLDGIELIRRLREISPVPLIVLSGRTGTHDRIGALAAGAADYVTKPFAVEELLLRLRAAMPAADEPIAASVRIGQYLIDLPARRVEAADGRLVRLSETEWRLLGVLLSAPGQLVSTERLVAEAFPAGTDGGSEDHIRFQMARLRQKLENDPPRPQHLLTEPGIGYRYKP